MKQLHDTKYFKQKGENNINCYAIMKFKKIYLLLIQFLPKNNNIKKKRRIKTIKNNLKFNFNAIKLYK